LKLLWAKDDNKKSFVVRKLLNIFKYSHSLDILYTHTKINEVGLFHVRSTQVTTWPPQNWMIYCEIVVPVEISIPAKFYCFMATSFLSEDIQSCQKTRFSAQVVLYKVA
jgi:hypothetical protein